MIRCSCKCRVYPNKTQEEFFRQYLGVSRFIYNQCLSEVIYNYKIAKLFNAQKLPTINRSYLNSIFNYLRKIYPFLEDFDKSTLRTSYDPLIRSFRSFFNMHFGYPNFKSRKNTVQSVKINNNLNRIRVNGNHLYWRPLGYVRLHGFRQEIEGRILNVLIKLENSRWFIIINFESQNPQPFTKEGNHVGIDLGIKTLATLSDGTAKVKLQLDDINAKIKKYQRVLARRKLGGKNYNKTLKKLHKHFNKKNDIIQDYYHKISTEFVKKYDVIKMETLGIRGLLKNSKFSHNIHEVAWFKLKNMIKYKAEWYGKEVIEVPRFFASSQICSNCGFQNKNLKITDRDWKCPNCGQVLDRDLNASINILNWNDS